MRTGWLLLRDGVVRLLLTGAVGLVAVWGVAVGGDVRLVAPPPTAFITDRDGGFLTQAGHESLRPDGGRQVDYGYWPVDPPPRVVAATLALEDRRFWSHPGIDPAAVLRATWQHITGGHGSGASTVAMQVARMQHPRPRTLWAKAVEAGTALALTAEYGRAAVLAQYLRLAPYGENSHGIAHAARWYFDEPAEDLTVAQAAILSAIPQAPGRMALHRHRSRAAARARLAIAGMDLSPKDRDAALADLATLATVPTRRRPPFLQLALRLQTLAPAGGMVRATLDAPMQRWVTATATRQLRAWQQDGAQQVAVMVVRRHTREVLADVASAGFASQPGGAIDYSAILRSPGSTLKPFLYALGLDRQVIAPQDVMADLPEGAAGISNADHDFLGPLLPRQALANSRNVPATNLLRHIGLTDSFAFLRTIGLHALTSPAERYGLAMAIGALPTSLDRLMRAYATLAEDGMAADLRWFAGPAPEPHRVISIDSARLVGRFLSDPLARLPSFPRYGSSEFPFAVALKTGTSQGYRDAWTLEWSRDYLVGVWIGRADAGPMSQLSGGRAAALLAQSIMLRLHGVGRSDLLAGDFAAPPGREETELCTGTGQRAGPGCDEKLAEWVRPGATHPAAPPTPHLSITQPDPDTHVWRNPEAPPALNRLVLRATADPPVPQIVWLVDGKPVATTAPDAPLFWPMTPGRHHFQIRLPLAAGVSKPVAVIVE
ncbi:transglycosylase domain-containing protein [Acidisphaera sp. L21]|uniref:transglycosylase domain-containing protein n=1 Tax=Acidisphaera sp. L21 TaxID=1641851 RepID=UPI001C2048B4|nr:transglycosylase domain-containing protein [Acidisphaera sp. L21]